MHCFRGPAFLHFPEFYASMCPSGTITALLGRSGPMCHSSLCHLVNRICCRWAPLRHTGPLCFSHWALHWRTDQSESCLLRSAPIADSVWLFSFQ
ncbi:hypothetical protein GDO86_018292 [Hymenochirus boettgeri]|uniref:Uncharacterized protein n=1 Tax=Hymenochirus boettgeri TaxID=247094 RepID=A0A8T2IDU9_9PIPI|nr:hypothetical protein GDO86_018292 [Hymenochirus boettgeri]